MMKIRMNPARKGRRDEQNWHLAKRRWQSRNKDNDGKFQQGLNIEIEEAPPADGETIVVISL